MSLQIDQFTTDACTILYRGRLLLRYTATSTAPREESPKSYFHPLHTLAGKLVTDFRPADHPWHHGVAFAPTYVNEETFWGGPSFTTQACDYEKLHNHGRQEHLGWEITESKPDSIAWTQRLAWLDRADHALMEEERRVRVELLPSSDDRWRLSLEFVLRNRTDRELVLASPVCRGRPEGGYFGLMWRGAPSFAQGRVFTSDSVDSANLMGERAPWLAYVSPSAEASLLFLDHPENPCHPTPWFVRCGDQPIVSYSLAYHEPWIIAPGAELHLRYQMIIADRIWTREDAQSAAT